MRRLILKLDKAGIVWTVENPFTSLLWETSYWCDIKQHTDPFYCELHNCMFGGQRLKRTCIASNNKAIMALNVLCDGRHEHAPWSMTDGVFDTSLEAEYTPMLAKALASVILESIANEYKLKNVVQYSKRLKLSHFHAIAASEQPTKAMTMHLVPEFSHVLVLSNVPSSISFSCVDAALSTCINLQCDEQSFFIPCASKLLRKTVKKGGESRLFKFTVERTPSLRHLADVQRAVDSSMREVQPILQCKNASKTCSETVFVLESTETKEECADWVFGVRWTPEDFLRQAVYVGHPFSNFSGLPAEVGAACVGVASYSKVDIVNNRCCKLGEWVKLAKGLQQEELKCKNLMPAERRRILESKKLLLMRHIIEKEGYDDKSLVDDVSEGFSLVGEVPTSNVLPRKLLPAAMSEQELHANSQRANVALRYMTRSSGDRGLDEKLWDKTMAEVDKGWLLGPLSWDTLKDGDTVSGRFPLEQGEKVRPIDDLSQSQINSTVTCYEQATVDGPDVICAFATFLMRCLAEHGKSTALMGRSLDLASAYRQLAIADGSRKHAFLSVFNPASGSADLFQQVALPFGSRTAVNAFIRCARFLQWTSAKCLRLPLSCYFDDFVSFSPPELAGNSQAALCLMLDVLGWGFDKEGPKSDDYSQMVCALGVKFDLSSCKDGFLNVCNTEKRVRETSALLDEILEQGLLKKRDALVVRGRLAFCDAFIFGRLGKVALQELTRHAYAAPFCEKISNSLRDALKVLKERVLGGKPRLLSCRMLDTMYLLTDASFEPGRGAGLGAVLVSSDGAIISWFGIHVSIEQLSALLMDGKETVIGELETLAVAMALLLWADRLCSTQLLVYIDNEGSRYSLIKGYSASRSITSICALAATTLDAHYILPWFGRIPSISNLADFPSRQLSHPMLRADAEVPKEEVEAIFESSIEFVRKASSPQ